MEQSKSGTPEFQVFDGMNLNVPIPTRKGIYTRERRPSRLHTKSLRRIRYLKEGGSMTITWFHSLSLHDLENSLSFPESLMMVNDAGSTVGKYYCSVKKSILIEEPCFLVHFGSCSTMPDGLECGISVTGFIDYNLHPIQEFTHEWIEHNGKMVERRFVLIKEEDKSQFYCKNIVRENGEVRGENSFAISMKDMSKVVTEAANVIFQRVIILQNKTGEIDLRALTSKGTRVRANFRTLGNGYENIRGEEMRVWGIRRTIFDGKDVSEWDCIFSDHARMVLRCQPDRDHALIPLWFKSVEKYDNSGEFIGTRPPLVWACDMELYAQYLERKDLVVSDHKAYLMDHPQVRALLADFVQALLQKKPCNVINFAKFFFDPYVRKTAALDLAASDSDTDDEDRKNCPMCDDDSFSCSTTSQQDTTEVERTAELPGEGGDAGQQGVIDDFDYLKEVPGELDGRQMSEMSQTRPTSAGTTTGPE